MDVEFEADWRSEEGLFWAGLVDAGFIDVDEHGAYAWHDYYAHNGKAILARLRNRGDAKPDKPTLRPYRPDGRDGYDRTLHPGEHYLGCLADFDMSRAALARSQLPSVHAPSGHVLAAADPTRFTRLAERLHGTYDGQAVAWGPLVRTSLAEEWRKLLQDAADSSVDRKRRRRA